MNKLDEQSHIAQELELRRRIEDFYLPRQLVNAIVEAGGIHKNSKETQIAIGFLDIAHYTFLSQFLSPPENQIVLNGLFSAFNWVLAKHGGYLNKIEGDCIMFHFGGPTDPAVKDLEDAEAEEHIARELFYSCVELQRTCSLFNQIDTDFMDKIKDESIVNAVHEAYKILGELRKGFISDSFNALFQIRVRIGASFGNVLIGNFGPDGAKQWDIIGMPVIEAKRMEASAPIGGVRITAEFYEILKRRGITAEYFQRIKREAKLMGSVYKDISLDELFKRARVYMKDKTDVAFDTYSIQVNPQLPESICNQSKLLLARGEKEADVIVSFIKYYRGNAFVINEMEELFHQAQVQIRKDSLYRIMFPGEYKTMLLELDGDVAKLREKIDQKYSLYDLLVFFGKLQDSVKSGESADTDSVSDFPGYDRWMAEVRSSVQRSYVRNKNITHKSYYFYHVIFPLFFANIKVAILEFQNRVKLVENLENLEDLEDLEDI